MTQRYFSQRENAIGARRRRKSKHWAKGGAVEQRNQKRARSAEASLETTACMVQKWLDNLYSEGSNNSLTACGIEDVVEHLSRVKAFHKDLSCFVDMGSGCGLPCIYVAKRYGCRVVGVEKEAHLVALAREYAKEAGVANLCEFFCCNFETLDPGWLAHMIRPTHMFIFDAVFRSETWNVLFHQLLPALEHDVVGASVAKHARYWPECLEEEVTMKKKRVARLAGSSSTFRIKVWWLKKKEKR